MLGLGAAALGCALPANADDALDWSVGLRGSYSESSVNGSSFEAVAAPEATLTLGGQGGTLKLGAGAQLAVGLSGSARLADVHASVDGAYAIDPDSSLAGSANVSLTQAAPGSPASPTNTAIAPSILSGTAEGSGTRKLGLFDVTARIGGARVLEGDETLYDATVIGHADDSYWQDGAGLRLGFEMSPLLSVFADGEISDQHFDAASPSLLVVLDNRLYTLRGGVSYAQGSVISAELSAGQAFIDYGDGSLGDASAIVANGTLTFTPDDTLNLSVALDTTVRPSDAVPGDTDASYALSGNASYSLNPWLTLRGSAGATLTQTLGAGALSLDYSAGAGVDLSTSSHVVWSADYLFTHDGSGPEDIHTLTLGLKVKG